MSFILELEAPRVDEETARRLEQATEQADYLPVRASRRRRWRRASETGLTLRDRRGDVPVLSDDADWSEDAFTFDERGRELLARTVSLLADDLRPGWALRAYWVGDPCEEERAVTADELVDLVRSSALQRIVRYRVA